VAVLFQEPEKVALLHGKTDADSAGSDGLSSDDLRPMFQFERFAASQGLAGMEEADPLGQCRRTGVAYD
jgi:hypothetical protein